MAIPWPGDAWFDKPEPLEEEPKLITIDYYILPRTAGYVLLLNPKLGDFFAGIGYGRYCLGQKGGDSLSKL